MAALASAIAAVGFVAVTVLAGIDARSQLASVYAFVNGPGPAAMLPAVLLLAAAQMTLRARFVPQMLARAIWWSNLIVGTLMAHLLAADGYRTAGTVAALACGVAILVTGRRGLDHSVEDAAADRFRPVAFRGLLTVALVMAFADAQTLAFSGILQLGVGARGWTWLTALTSAGPTFVCAVVMAVAVWGLLRLRTWALLLNLVANFVIAGLALHGHLGLATPVAATLAGTALVQAFLPVPILARAAGGPWAERAVLLPHGGRFAAVIVLGGMVLAATGLSKRGHVYSAWLDGQGRAYMRYTPRPTDTADFRGANLTDQSLRDISVPGADFTDATLMNTDLAHADLRDSTWADTVVSDVDLFGADLRGAVFRDLQIHDVDLREADLRGATFERVQFVGGSLVGASLDQASVDETTFTDVSWIEVECPNRMKTTTATPNAGGPPPLDPEVEFGPPGGCEYNTVGNTAEDAKLAGHYEPTKWALAHDSAWLPKPMAAVLGVPQTDLTERPTFEVELLRAGETPVLRVGSALVHRVRGIEPPLHHYVVGDSENDRPSPHMWLELMEDGTLRIRWVQMRRRAPDGRTNTDVVWGVEFQKVE
jgi:uncharacterized protein YjbI with pentapeptide repeats